MTRIASFFTLVVFSTIATAQSILPDVPDGVQAISLLGEELRSGEPSERLLQNLATARSNYENNPDDADNIIWLGRRIAYTGDYRGAIEAFSEGIEKHPDDARMYRHRGHRYISIRELDRAIADFEHAVTLIEGTQDEVEPDGAPNPAGIPVSTLHSNIWYHLGLAYYLKGDLDNALRIYEIASPQIPNDDMRVAFTHWHYMTLRLLGRDSDARALLEPIHEDMNVIESMPYHQLCLLYKGESETGSVLGANITAAGGDSAMYGIANWHYYNGRLDEAKAGFEEMIEKSGWASFGRIAAESDLARKY
ncbi:MAG: tetratricopeptide repeat protein [Gammaproteobacteria bacterium]|nr:tetratricopeptide repeat protein [Gammaproteobacteria bacterium]